MRRARQHGGVLPYFIAIAGAVALAAAVALSNVSSLARTSGDSRANTTATRTLGWLADTAISLGYAELADGRPALPTLTTPAANVAPVGGSALPIGLGGTTAPNDPWGSAYGFCNFTNWTWSGWNTPMFAVVSAGKDKTYQTSCSDIFNSGARKGDDLVRVVTAADWRLAATSGKTAGYKPPLNLLTDLNTVVPAGPGEVRLVLETKEVYINPQGQTGSANWQLITGPVTGATNGKYVKRDAWGMRKWSDGTVPRSCTYYLQPPVGYAYTGDIGDGVYWIQPRLGGPAWGMYCDMTSDVLPRNFFTGLIAYWPMDEGQSGQMVYDGFRTINFVLNSTPTAGIVPVSTGPSPAARSVTGRSQVTLTDLTTSPVPTQVTISAWLDTTTLQAGVMPFGFAYWDAYVTLSNATTANIGFNTAQSDAFGTPVRAGMHHFVFVFDSYASSQARGYVDERVYVDGVRMPLSYLTSPYTENGANRSWTSALNIGGWTGDNNTAYWPSNAVYSDVAVWGRALTDTEIHLIYTSHNTFGGMLTMQAGFVQTNGVWTNVDGTARASCSEYKTYGARASGVYLVNPSAPYTVFCDQTSDGGGWTLLMKQAAGDGATLQGDTVYWTQPGNTLNDTQANQNFNDGNFVSRAFSTMSATQYRLRAANETTEQFYTAAAASTPQYAFSDANVTVYNDPNGQPGTAANWNIRATTVPDGTTILSARFGANITEGNGTSSPSGFCSVRWGWLASTAAGQPGNFKTCGGLGAFGIFYGTYRMPNKNAWQPSTLYLWAK